MPGKAMSSTKRASPVRCSASSLRSAEVPIPFPFSGTRRRLDRLDDVVVAGAPAEVPFERLANLVVGRVRVPCQDLGRGHDHPGGAVAALEGVVLVKRALKRVQLAVLREALDRLHLKAVGLEGEHRAGLDRPAVEANGARAAARGIAADVRA